MQEWEAWLRSVRGVGQTSGLYPGDTRTSEAGLLASRAHAYRTQEETLAAWSLGLGLTEKTRGLKLERKKKDIIHL